MLYKWHRISTYSTRRS